MIPKRLNELDLLNGCGLSQLKNLGTYGDLHSFLVMNETLGIKVKDGLSVVF